MPSPVNVYSAAKEFSTNLDSICSVGVRYTDNEIIIYSAGIEGKQGFTEFKTKLLGTLIKGEECYFITKNRSPRGCIPGESVLYENRNGIVCKLTEDSVDKLIISGFKVVPLLPKVQYPHARAVLSRNTNQALSLTDKDQVVIASIISTISVTDTEQYLADLQNMGTRYAFNGNPGAVRDYLVAKLQSFGYTPEIQAFLNRNTTNYNVIATLPGETMGNKSFIICAHHDSISNDPYTYAPGVDDNATGVAGVLAAAKCFKQQKFNYTIKFILFGGEEQGMVGSRYFVNKDTSTDIAGVLNMDMIGYWSTGKKYDLELTANTASEWMAWRVKQVSETYGIGMPVNIVIDDGAYWSDHSSFWIKNKTAVMASEAYDWSSEDFNPYYHSGQDTVSALDLVFFHKNVKLCIAAVAELANPYDSPTNVAVLRPYSLDDTVFQGSMYTIRWDGTGDSVVELYYSDYRGVSDKKFITQLSGPTGTYDWDVTNIAPGMKYIYVYSPVLGTGEWSSGAVTVVSRGMKDVYVYPNPVRLTQDNPQAMFVGLGQKVKVRIFDIAGQLVYNRDVEDEYKWPWRCRGNGGYTVSSGVYIYRITNDEGNSMTGKIAVVK
ncbi:MAG: M20/M25/M40 family metallo-hydrolase [Elusimicrobiota bacterium]